MTIQYDGSNFHGWQVQAKGRTVQGDIEMALQKIHLHETIILNGSGRTDSGVHAKGQVASIKMDSSLTAEQLVKALNSGLGKDVRIMSCKEVDEDFHARFSAKERADSFMGSNATLDDIEGFSGRVLDHSWSLNIADSAL